MTTPAGMPLPQPNGQPGAPMPTGMPAYQPPTVVQPQSNGQGISYPPSQIPQPTPAPQPGQGGQPAPQPQPQPGPVQPVGPQTVLDGPDIPIELRGRPINEVIQIYQGLRNIQLQRTAGQPPIPQPQPVPQPQNNQPAGQPTGTQWDWRNPQAAIREAVQQVIQETVYPALAPVVQQSHQTAVANAEQQIMNEVGAQRWAQLRPLVYQRLGNVDPRALTAPEMWRTAAHAVAGELALRGQFGGSTPQSQPQPQPQLAATPAQPQPVQVIGQPIPNLNSFYAEQPTGGAVGGAALTQEELNAAAAMKMTPAQYAAWKGGIPSQR